MLDHVRGRTSESTILAYQGCHTVMNFTRNSVVQAPIQPFVIVEGGVTRQTNLQVRHRSVGVREKRKTRELAPCLYPLVESLCWGAIPW